jgi:hypothetical protein
MSDFTPKLPEVKFNKNGYEIRADILALAKEHVDQEYKAKYAGWEFTAKRDAQTNQVVTTVAMPEYPGMEKVIEAAEKFYAFVNTGATKK